MKPFVVLQREIAFYRAVHRDPRTPAISRWCLRAAIAYLLSPIDLIPDFVPVLGQLDDVIIVSLLLAIARFFVPAQVLTEHRRDPEPSASETPAVCDGSGVRGDKLPLNDDQEMPLKTPGNTPAAMGGGKIAGNNCAPGRRSDRQPGRDEQVEDRDDATE